MIEAKKSVNDRDISQWKTKLVEVEEPISNLTDLLSNSKMQVSTDATNLVYIPKALSMYVKKVVEWKKI